MGCAEKCRYTHAGVSVGIRVRRGGGVGDDGAGRAGERVLRVEQKGAMLEREGGRRVREGADGRDRRSGGK